GVAVGRATARTPLPPMKDVRDLRLGEVEILVAVSRRGRLAGFERIPRAELSHETVLDWPRSLNPTLIDHFRRSLFEGASPPEIVEISDMTDASRLHHVAEGKGIAMVLASTVPELAPGVVVRRFEDPVPT